MTFEEYQQKSRTTALYPNAGANFIYPTLGLVSEAGEVAGKVKKVMRDDNGVVSDEKREDIKGELGDVLWYVSQCATEFGLSLDDIAQSNIEKLFSRKDRGVLGGSGDDR
ncbi:MAG TPA: nucleoside triphosphate pyrophosphohydrolase family protein [Patescibacteria group bacterium]|nr:nucleoside triphosphate pyrophosphohydrolase family protein [Patescibacteria group bacterium]